MDRVKAYVALTIELTSITKPVQMLPWRKISFARSEFRRSRNKVSEEIFAQIPRGATLVFTLRTRSKMNRARSLRKHSPTKSHPRDKTGKKLISRDFLASDCQQQLFDHDSCESGSAGSSLPLSSIFDRLELYIE